MLAPLLGLVGDRLAGGRTWGCWAGALWGGGTVGAWRDPSPRTLGIRLTVQLENGEVSSSQTSKIGAKRFDAFYICTIAHSTHFDVSESGSQSVKCELQIAVGLKR